MAPSCHNINAFLLLHTIINLIAPVVENKEASFTYIKGILRAVFPHICHQPICTAYAIFVEVH
jgi:hypothetical protein